VQLATKLRGPLASLLVLAALPVVAAPEPVRLGGRSFGWPAQIEIRDLERGAAEAAIAEAFAEIERARVAAREIEQRSRSGAELALDPAALELVRRAQAICYWSEGTLGPGGGELFRLWGLHVATPALPTPDALAVAVDSARCDQVGLDAENARFRVAPGTLLDLAPFDLGWAVDRAAERLKELGSANFWIAVGPLSRAAGAGPDGRGWRIDLPLFAGQEEALPAFYLRDRSLAVLVPDQRPLRIAGDSYPPFVDFRTGRPATGIVGLLVVTPLAADALAVGEVMFARGEREGTMLLGALEFDERPSIRWLLGGGEGPPLLVDLNWGAVPKR